MNPKLRDAVAVGEIRLATLSGMREGGLKSLAASGALRVISGETTVAEILEAVGPTFWSDLVEYYGTQISTEALEHLPQRAVAGQGILLMTGDGELRNRLEPLLQEHGFRLLIASTRDDAVEILKRDEDIVFIISDELGDQASASEAAEFLRQNRQAIAWARLPSIVLIPHTLSADEAFLLESGVMGTLMAKPIDTETLLAHVRRSQVR
jgi:CheY-like chemotaxis protein